MENEYDDDEHLVTLVRYWMTKSEMLWIEKKALYNILKDREVIVTSEEYFLKINEASDAYIKEKVDQTKRTLERYDSKQYF